MITVRSPYNYDPDVVSFQSGLDCSDSPSRAQQHMRDETDINVMVARFQRTGMPQPPLNVPALAEFEGIFDFQSAMQTVVDSRVAFGELPAKMRARFHNDPGEFLAFVHDDSNREEAVFLGLVPKPVVAQEQQPDSGSVGDNPTSDA